MLVLIIMLSLWSLLMHADLWPCHTIYHIREHCQSEVRDSTKIWFSHHQHQSSDFFFDSKETFHTSAAICISGLCWSWCNAWISVLIIFLYRNFILTFVTVIMPQHFAVLLNQVWWESYCAQNYAGIMYQGLVLNPVVSQSKIFFEDDENLHVHFHLLHCHPLLTTLDRTIYSCWRTHCMYLSTMQPTSTFNKVFLLFIYFILYLFLYVYIWKSCIILYMLYHYLYKAADGWKQILLSNNCGACFRIINIDKTIIHMWEDLRKGVPAPKNGLEGKKLGCPGTKLMFYIGGIFGLLFTSIWSLKSLLCFLSTLQQLKEDCLNCCLACVRV